MLKFFLIAAVAILFFSPVILHPIRSLRALLFSAVTGNAALLAVAYLGVFTQIPMAVNLFTVATATLLGIPGVISMLLFKLIFAV